MTDTKDPLVHTLESFQQEQEKVKEQIMSTRLTPRRAQVEQKKILTQTVVFVLLTIVLGLAMVFVIIPGLIRFAGSLTGIANPANNDTVAPRVPIYSAPVAATKDQELVVEGFGEPESLIYLMHNGVKSEERTADAEGKFVFTISLDEGENVIAFYSADAAGNESAVGREYVTIYDTQAPEIEWATPEDGKLVTNLRERMIEVKGKTSEVAKIYLNDRLVFSDSEGNFTDSFQLQEGENTLRLKAIDEAGNESEQERKVTFRP